MKTILLTGATGFLGRHLARRHSQDGYRLRCIVRDPKKASHLFQQDIEVLIGDLSVREFVHNAVEGVDSIVHAAGQVGGWGTKESYAQNNVIATRNLLDGAVRHGIKRFIYVSSVASYGMQADRQLTEDSPPKFESEPYCQTKLECERLVREISKSYKMTATVLRPSIIFGPFDPRFLRRVVRHVRAGIVVSVGRRNQGPPLVYVEDVVNFTAAILHAQSSQFEVYNLCSPENVSWERIVEEVSRRLGIRARLVRIPFRLAYAVGAVLEFYWKLVRASRPPLITRWLAALVGLSYHFDSSKARSVHGFLGFTSFSAAIDASIRWFLQEEQSAKAPNGKKHVAASAG